MNNRKREIEELEYLEREFIIDSQELTEEQKELLENIYAMELQRGLLLNRIKRYERVIDALHQKLANSYYQDKER